MEFIIVHVSKQFDDITMGMLRFIIVKSLIVIGLLINLNIIEAKNTVMILGTIK